MPAIDEDETEWCSPETGGDLGTRNDRNDSVLEGELLDGLSEQRECINPARFRIQELRVVVLAAWLLFFGSPVMVDGKEHPAFFPARYSQIGSRAATVAAYFQAGTVSCSFPGNFIQTGGFVVGHESFESSSL